MEVIADTENLRPTLDGLTHRSETLAFVPTMGNLHDGHLALVTRARELADKIAVSIFINPMQFGSGEDLSSYPRTLEEDIAQLTEAGVDLVFTPTTADIYPEGAQNHTQVRVPGLTDVLCGASRPGHFDGVTSICCKLFNLIRPNVAVFGEKDLQQVIVIRKMVQDLALSLSIASVPTTRAADGLALSSRNGYLTREQRARAPLLYQTLVECGAAISNGSRDFQTVLSDAKMHLSQGGFDTDYLEIRRRHDLQPATPGDDAISIFAAARLGNTRLIDNLSL